MKEKIKELIRKYDAEIANIQEMYGWEAGRYNALCEVVEDLKKLLGDK